MEYYYEHEPIPAPADEEDATWQVWGQEKKNKDMAQPILMTEEYWANSQFSIVRYTGQMKMSGIVYIICNKEGKDIFQCSIEAEKEGREKAIEPGEPCDLIDQRYLPVYRKLGREAFIELIKEHAELTPDKAFELAGIEEKKSKTTKKARR